MKLRLYNAWHGATLSITGLPQRLVEAVTERLKVRNPVWEAAMKFSTTGYISPRITEYLLFGWAYENELTMYRGALSMLNKQLRRVLALCRWKDLRMFVPVKFPDLVVTLNDEQKYCMGALEDILEHRRRRFGNMLFIASTSVGKTILQASIAARLGQKTLVLCPTELIRRAWEEDLRKAFNFTRKEIGLIKQKKWEEGKVFTLASTPTIGRRRGAWEELNREFGTIIVDEVQGVGADTYFDFLTQSPAAYIIGATATMENRDGSINYPLKALFGDPIVQIDTYHRETANSLRISEVKLVSTPFQYEHQVDNIDWNALANAIAADEERNALIIENVKKEWLDKRTILIVTKRIEHVRLLHQMAEESGIANANILTGETNSDKFYTTRLLSLVKARKITCVIATMQAIKVGANVPALDSLHIAMPPANRRDLEQLMGRIRRKCEKKTEATVTYYYDDKLAYMLRLFRRVVIPTFRKMKIPGYEHTYVT